MTTINNAIHILLKDIVLYSKNTEVISPILSGISAEVLQQSITAIIGPSGSGKSTLLRIMNGLIEPDQGEVFLSGTPYRDIPPRELRRKVGMVFQEPTLLPGTVRSNLQFPFQLVGRCPAWWEESAHFWLKQVNLNPSTVWDRDVSDFSLGEKQRIALIRTLLTNPEVLLLDEPTAALDPGNTSFIVDIVRRWNHEKHITVVWVTHTLEVARQVADQIWVMQKGQLLEVGDTTTVLHHPSHEETRRFLNGDAI
jgi:putative ABC transport system ATP-binding protein